jgi:hypothetical protein
MRSRLVGLTRVKKLFAFLLSSVVVFYSGDCFAGSRGSGYTTPHSGTIAARGKPLGGRKLLPRSGQDSWDMLLEHLDSNNNLIVGEGFDKPITRGKIRRVSDHPCDALSVVDMYEAYRDGNDENVCAVNAYIGTGYSEFGQVGITYRGLAPGSLSPDVGGSGRLSVPLESSTLAPSVSTSPYSDGQRWPHSPMPDPYKKVSGTHGLRWTYSEYQAIAAGYNLSWEPEAGYTWPYTAASAGTFYITSFCNNWEEGCPNSFGPDRTRDLWIRTSYYFGSNLFNWSDPVPEWVSNYCTDNPGACRGGSIDPGDLGSVMISSRDEFSYPTNMTEGQFKGFRFFGSHGDTCRDKYVSSGVYDYHYYDLPSAANKYSCMNGTNPYAPSYGIQINSINPTDYFLFGSWAGSNIPFYSCSDAVSSDSWPDKDTGVYLAIYGDVDYAPSKPHLTGSAVKTTSGWTITLDSAIPDYFDPQVGDPIPFRPTSCTGMSCNTSTFWGTYGYIGSEYITDIDNSNPNAPVITTTNYGNPTWQGTATLDIAFRCSRNNVEDQSRYGQSSYNPTQLFPRHNAGCKAFGSGKWYTSLVHIYYLDDTTQHPQGCELGGAIASSCNEDRKGNAISPPASTEAPARMQIWLKEEGGTPWLVLDRPFTFQNPYPTLSGEDPFSWEYSELGDPEWPKKVLDGFRIDHERFYALPSKFWNGTQKEGYSRPADDVYITVDNLLVATGFRSIDDWTINPWTAAP